MNKHLQILILILFFLDYSGICQIPFHHNDLEKDDLKGKVKSINEVSFTFFEILTFTKKKNQYNRITEYNEQGYIVHEKRISDNDTLYDNYTYSSDSLSASDAKKVIENSDTIILFVLKLDSLGRVKEMVKYFSEFEGCGMYPGTHLINDGGNDYVYKETYDYTDESGSLNFAFSFENDEWKETEGFSYGSTKYDKKRTKIIYYDTAFGKHTKMVLKFKKFDENGNWAKSVLWSRGLIPVEISKRIINYTENNKSG